MPEMKRKLLVLFILILTPLIKPFAQCNSISDVSFSIVNTNPCEFPKEYNFNSNFVVDSTPEFISTQNSFANFQLPFDLTFPTNNNNCKYLLEIDGSYTSWGNHERYDAYCKFNNNINALITVGGGLGDDLTPNPIQAPNAYNTSHVYSYYFNGDGNDVKFKFRDNNYSDNDGTAEFNWYAVPTFNYEWDFGDGNTSNLQNPSHTFTKAGSFRVVFRITDLLTNCTDSFDTTITVLPKAEVDLGQSAVICPPSTFTLNPGAFQNYLWQDGSIDSAYVARSPGTYWVEVVDALGCTASDSILIEESCYGEVLVPNAFTPNDDGLNDVFKAYSHRTKLTHFHMYIFDRRGILLFETQDIGTGWDGTFDGNKVANGTYVYKLAYGGIVDNEKFHRNDAGTLVVVR